MMSAAANPRANLFRLLPPEMLDAVLRNLGIGDHFRFIMAMYPVCRAAGLAPLLTRKEYGMLTTPTLPHPPWHVPNDIVAMVIDLLNLPDRISFVLAHAWFARSFLSPFGTLDSATRRMLWKEHLTTHAYDL